MASLSVNVPVTATPPKPPKGSTAPAKPARTTPVKVTKPPRGRQLITQEKITKKINEPKKLIKVEAPQKPARNIYYPFYLNAKTRNDIIKEFIMEEQYFMLREDAELFNPFIPIEPGQSIYDVFLPMWIDRNAVTGRTIRQNVGRLIQANYNDIGSMKISMILYFERKEPVLQSDGTYEYKYSNFIVSGNQVVLINPISETGITSNEALNDVIRSFRDSNITKNNSANIEIKLKKILIKISKFQPLVGSSYMELPEWLANKKCCINVKNNDQLCFAYSIACHITKRRRNLHMYEYLINDVETLNLNGICSATEPAKLLDSTFKRFEKQNPNIPPLNVLKLKQNARSINSIEVIYTSERTLKEEPITLLYIYNDTNGHFVYVTDLNRLLRREGDTNAHEHCYRCLQSFHGINAKFNLDDHMIYCNGINMGKSQKVTLPKIGSKIKYEDRGRTEKLQYFVCADFESLLYGFEEHRPDISTEKTQKHNACSYAYFMNNANGDLVDLKLYRGERSAEKFILDMQRIYKQFSISPNKLPVYLHNSKGYDNHLIIEELHKVGGHISVVAQNEEKYITLSIGNIQFIDSFSFMASSLDELSYNLSIKKAGASKDKNILYYDKFINTKRLLNMFNSDKIELLAQKGVYPYEYMDSFDKFNQTELPPINKFYSSLTGKSIEIEDYQHALNVWNVFKCRTLGDYHDLYLWTDVALLTDIFTEFRNTMISVYELDPCYYYTLPAYAWDCALKFTGIELDNLTNIDMYMFFERGIRGGMSGPMALRQAKANNKYKHDHDPTQESTYINYLDMNNLYGYAMSLMLPSSGFLWEDPREFTREMIINLLDDSEIGYVFEVDLSYPAELHDLHNDYPLAPENRIIDESELSPYQLNLKGDRKINDKKLIVSLNDKSHYIVHYRNLKYYLKMGLVLTKIHKVMSFTQSEWLKPFILKNTDLRKVAKSDFEKDLWKLMNNAVFGKTMENVRKRRDIQLIRVGEQRLQKWINSSMFINATIINDDLVIAEKTKSNINLDKPIYAGFTILDNSKLHMYQFWYDYIKPKYGNKATLMYTDTDSLVTYIRTDDIYADFGKGSSDSPFDTSKCIIKEYQCDDNKKVIGKMKDECDGHIIYEFIGLRPKMYNCIIADEEDKKKCKGIKKVVTSNYTRDDFANCLLSGSSVKAEQSSLRSYAHHIYTIKQNKIALDPFDSKRYILDDGINTLAFGHYKINNLINS